MYPRWEQLVLKVPDLRNNDLPRLAEGAWSALLHALQGRRSVEIDGPSEHGWFHFRWKAPAAPAPGAPRPVEIMRLRVQSEVAAERQVLFETAQRIDSVTAAVWKVVPALEQEDKAFLAFLQKISVLHVSYKMTVPGHLKDPEPETALKAFAKLMQPCKPWSNPLGPWIRLLSNPSSVERYKYGHWFGYILSEW